MTEQPQQHAPPIADAEYDAGDMACGELMILLRARLKAMPGGTLKVTATDPGAPADIPAYCRMTGHQLLHTAGSSYWIRARP